MSTKLLEQIRAQDQDALAAQHNGETRQAPRVWVASFLKPELTEAEFAAAQRGVRECILWFPGAKANMDRVDMAWSDAFIANRTDAGQAFNGMLKGVENRTNFALAKDVAEWIVRLHTIHEIAQCLGLWRKMGRDRDPIPDVRAARPPVRLVLIAMANYYDDCDRGRERWRGA